MFLEVNLALGRNFIINHVSRDFLPFLLNVLFHPNLLQFLLKVFLLIYNIIPLRFDAGELNILLPWARILDAVPVQIGLLSHLKGHV